VSTDATAGLVQDACAIVCSNSTPSAANFTSSGVVSRAYP
jgi:hypothetical protein